VLNSEFSGILEAYRANVRAEGTAFVDCLDEQSSRSPEKEFGQFRRLHLAPCDEQRECLCFGQPVLVRMGYEPPVDIDTIGKPELHLLRD